MKNKYIEVTLVKSIIGCTHKQRSTVLGLGLKKLNQTRKLENTSSVRGMVKKVIHLLKINELN